MKGRYLLFIVSVWMMAACDTQSTLEDPTKTRFVRFYGTDGDQTGKDLVVLPDGSMLLFGTTRPTGKASQWYLVKVNAEGIKQWEYEFGGPLDDEASDIEISGANEVVLVGNTYNSATERDIHIMRVTFDGIVVTPGGEAVVGYTNSSGNTDEDASSVTVTNDGFIVTGSTSQTDPLDPADQRDALHIRFYTDLSLTYPGSWKVKHSKGPYDAGVRVITGTGDPLAKYYLLGYSNKSSTIPGYNFWFYPLDDFGEGAYGDVDIGDIGDEKLFDAVGSSSGTELFLAGQTTNSSTLTTDAYVAKLVIQVVSASQVETPVVYNKPLSYQLGNGAALNGSAFRSKSGGYYFVTNELSVANDQNWLLSKVDDSGLAWSLPITFGGEGMDTCGGIQELPDGHLVLVGTMRTGRPDAGEYKMTLVKVNSLGKFEK